MVESYCAFYTKSKVNVLTSSLGLICFNIFGFCWNPLWMTISLWSVCKNWLCVDLLLCIVALCLLSYPDSPQSQDHCIMGWDDCVGAGFISPRTDTVSLQKKCGHVSLKRGRTFLANWMLLKLEAVVLRQWFLTLYSIFQNPDQKWAI